MVPVGKGLALSSAQTFECQRHLLLVYRRRVVDSDAGARTPSRQHKQIVEHELGEHEQISKTLECNSSAILLHGSGCDARQGGCDNIARDSSLLCLSVDVICQTAKGDCDNLIIPLRQLHMMQELSIGEVFAGPDD